MSSDLDDAIRLEFAEALWKYYEAPDEYGDLADNKDSGSLSGMLYKVCLDEGDAVLQVMLKSPNVRERIKQLEEQDRANP